MRAVEDDAFQRTVLRNMLESIALVSTADTYGKPSPSASPESASARIRRIGSSGTPPSPSKSPPKSLKLHVEFAEDGERAWELMSSSQFHLVLCDIHLPGVSGLDLSWCYQQLLVQAADAAQKPSRGQPAQPSTDHATIIIACTSDETANEDNLRQYGINDILRKPVSTQTLRHVLHKWMCVRASERDAHAHTALRSHTRIHAHARSHPADLVRRVHGRDARTGRATFRRRRCCASRPHCSATAAASSPGAS